MKKKDDKGVVIAQFGPELKEKLRIASEREGRSMSNLLKHLLNEHLRKNPDLLK